MDNQIRLEIAIENDAEQIKDLMVIVEEDETLKWFDKGERPYIPGFNSIHMQKYHTRDGKYYKILKGSILVGVILISTTGREHARIDLFYIHPTFQGMGIGSKVLQSIENKYPEVITWSLDTTQKSPRNHFFYEKNGYILQSEDEFERYYYKTIANTHNNSSNYISGKKFSSYNFRECNLSKVDFLGCDLRNTFYSNLNMRNSRFQNSNLQDMRFTNNNLSYSIFGDSNMSNVEICHVSLANVYIHDINLGTVEKQPLIMERCELVNSKISDSNLENLSVNGCNIQGMTIDGMLVTELLENYRRIHNT